MPDLDKLKAAHITPYTVWNIAIDDERSPHIDISRVTKVKMVLSGYADVQ